jgi:hypothetical protein
MKNVISKKAKSTIGVMSMAVLLRAMCALGMTTGLP